jgi:hypothetical protein
MAQKDKQFGPPYPLHNLFFLRGKGDWRQPMKRLHASSPYFR